MYMGGLTDSAMAADSAFSNVLRLPSAAKMSTPYTSATARKVSDIDKFLTTLPRISAPAIAPGSDANRATIAPSGAGFLDGDFNVMGYSIPKKIAYGAGAVILLLGLTSGKGRR